MRCKIFVTHQTQGGTEMDEQYYDIERRTAVKESARELRRKFLRYKDAEVVYSTVLVYNYGHGKLNIL